MTELIAQAVEILRKNDRGTYTVPTHGLYPFQWNWDQRCQRSGLFHIDEARAWTEIETLFAHQWEDGMVPHIIFHKQDDGYFPGPEVWDTRRPVPTSGITQPPVAGFAVRRLFDRATRQGHGAQTGARAACPKSTPGTTGSTAAATLRAPGWWRSSIPGNRAATIPSTGTTPSSGCRPKVSWPFSAATSSTPTRRTGRPQEQYKRYIWLVQQFRSLGLGQHQAARCLALPGRRSRVQRDPDLRSCMRSGRSRRGTGRDRAGARPAGPGGAGARMRWRRSGATPIGNTCAMTG